MSYRGGTLGIVFGAEFWGIERLYFRTGGVLGGVSNLWVKVFSSWKKREIFVISCSIFLFPYAAFASSFTINPCQRRQHIKPCQQLTSVLSWKMGDCMSLGLPTPMQLPSESDVSSSCSDSLEFTFSDFTMVGEITDERENTFISTMDLMKNEKIKQPPLCTCSRRTLNDIREGVATRAVGAPPRLLFGLYLGFLELDFPEIVIPCVHLWNVKTAYHNRPFHRSSDSRILKLPSTCRTDPTLLLLWRWTQNPCHRLHMPSDLERQRMGWWVSFAWQESK